MTNITDSDGWVNVTRPEATDLALGGNEVNFPGKFFRELASRDRWIRNQLESLFGLGDTVAQDTTAEFTQVGVSAIAQGRLTVVSGDPFGVAVGAGTLYYTPYNGDYIALYDSANSRWNLRQFTEISFSLSGLGAEANYDVFAFWNGSSVSLQTVPWAVQGFGNSVRAQAISQINGTWVKSSDNRRYLGTIRTSGVGQTEVSGGSVFVWNVQNQVPRSLYVTQPVEYNYNNVAYRFANNSTTAARVQVVVGLPNVVSAIVVARVGMAAGARAVSVAIGENSTVALAPVGQQFATADAAGTINTTRTVTIPLGANFYNTLESTGFNSPLRNPAILMQLNA